MKEIVLVGAGAAHIEVMRLVAQEPLVAARLRLVSPYAAGVYSPRLMDVMAGLRPTEEATFALEPLVKRARAEWVPAAVIAVDAARKRLTLDSGETLRYDLLSLNAGGMMPRDGIPGARTHGLFARPRERFILLWESVVSLSFQQTVNLVVVGEGMQAVDMALAAVSRLGERVRVVLLAPPEGLTLGLPAALASDVVKRLHKAGVTVLKDHCVDVTESHVHLASGARLACDVPLMLTALRPPPWLAVSGLDLDEVGRARTDDALRSTSHPEVFAVGHMAASGRQAQVINSRHLGLALATNLRRAAAGGAVSAAKSGRVPLWSTVSVGPHRHWLCLGGWPLGPSLLGPIARHLNEKRQVDELRSLQVPDVPTLPDHTRPASLSTDAAANDAQAISVERRRKA